VPQIIGLLLADPLTNAPGRRSRRLAGRAATEEEAVGLDKEAGEDRSALAPSSRVRALAAARHPARLGWKENPTAPMARLYLHGRQLFPKAPSSKP